MERAIVLLLLLFYGDKPVSRHKSSMELSPRRSRCSRLTHQETEERRGPDKECPPVIPILSSQSSAGRFDVCSRETQDEDGHPAASHTGKRAADGTPDRELHLSCTLSTNVSKYASVRALYSCTSQALVDFERDETRPREKKRKD